MSVIKDTSFNSHEDKDTVIYEDVIHKYQSVKTKIHTGVCDETGKQFESVKIA